MTIQRSRLIPLAAAILAVLVSPVRAQPADAFRGWASFIVAADWTDSGGQPIEAFDNARRDLALAFERAGFDRELMVDYSLNPDQADSVTPEAALQGFQTAAAQGTAGCLAYFTSHGAPAHDTQPAHIVFGPNGRIELARMRLILERTCGARPTVVVLSACFSGAFIPALSAPNRMVVTAARHDRTSFGCGAGITYPYFDGCIIETLPEAETFVDLAARARRCVSRREIEEGLTPPSEPQIFLGSAMQLMAPLLRFHHSAS